MHKNNAEFKEEFVGIWKEIAKTDGGKLSLTTIGIILGASLGGVGIAALGGAIGLPLFLILGLAGMWGGTEFDSGSIFGDKKKVTLKLPKSLYERINTVAEKSSLSNDELIIKTLEDVFSEEATRLLD